MKNIQNPNGNGGLHTEKRQFWMFVMCHLSDLIHKQSLDPNLRYVSILQNRYKSIIHQNGVYCVLKRNLDMNVTPCPV